MHLGCIIGPFPRAFASILWALMQATCIDVG